MAGTKGSKKRSTSSRRPTRAGRNSSSVEKVQIGVKRRVLSPIFLAIGAAFALALIIIFLIILWFVKIYADPQHVFWATIKQNLSTQSLTKTSITRGTASISSQFTTVRFSPNLRVHDIKQITDKSSRPASKITLETIGTATADYQRYSHIERPSSKLKQKDYQNIYNAWLKNGGQVDGTGQIAGNTLFGAVLFGDFNPTTEDKLFNELQNAYEIDFKSVNKHGDNHRRVYVYTVAIPLTKYAQAAHNYATALNLPLAAQINPKNYRPTDKLNVKISIDVLSREIKKIEYLNQRFSENYSGQGNAISISPPSKTVSASTFQSVIKPLNQ